MFGMGKKDDDKLREMMSMGGEVMTITMIIALARKMGIGPATLMRDVVDMEKNEQYMHEMAKEMMDIHHEKHMKESHNKDEVE